MTSPITFLLPIVLLLYTVYLRLGREFWLTALKPHVVRSGDGHSKHTQTEKHGNDGSPAEISGCGALNIHQPSTHSAQLREEAFNGAPQNVQPQRKATERAETLCLGRVVRVFA